MSRSGQSLFITGATGFVGAALTLELLRVHRRDRAFCLVRAVDDADARLRLNATLTRAAAAYGVHADELTDILPRVIPVRGDITRPGLGLTPGALLALAGDAPFTVWHSAASLKDNEESLHEIVLHNVTGTENLVEALLPVGVSTFNHVSTAYVAGRRAGVISETLERPRGFNNRYEQSKHYGENLVVDHCERAGVPWRVLRPGIVVAHSQTGRATGYTGFLGWVLKLAALAEATGGVLRRQPLRYVARPEAPLNVVPIDSIVEDCLGIDAAGDATRNRVFHLTNAAPPTIRWLCDVSAATLGLVPLELVADERELDPISAKFHKWTRFERPYSLGNKEFSRQASNALYPSPRHGQCPIDERLMQQMTLEALADFRAQQARQKEGVA
jgi:nucleoside-diphosphate-sugar epimerase